MTRPPISRPKKSMMELFRRVFITAVCVASFSPTDLASADNGDVDYLQQIKPIFHERCTACHGALKQEAGLRLDTATLAIKGGDSGPTITPGNAASSLLIQRVSANDESERMPPEGKPLAPEQITALRSWVAQDAPAPTDEEPEQDPRDHWAFRRIARPPMPKNADAAWERNPIDAFIAQKHAQFGLTPQAAAPPELLIRRLYLDLIGLPPSEDEVTRVLSTNDDGWYEPLVQRLLADPRHAERWARHWMDVWRYSDWWGLGEQLRNSQPHIWHWRDWIVESLNRNMPYDEMVRLMLAADELYPTDADKLRATGLLARNWALFGRNLWMEETVEHVCKGFLGLTMNCAKCHDHKYDPIAQVDFYRMRSFFEPYHVRLDRLIEETDLACDGIPRVFDGALDEPTYRFERGQESQPDKSTVIAPGVPEILAFNKLTIRPVSLPKEAWQPERRPGLLESFITAAQQNVASADEATIAATKKLDAARRQANKLNRPSPSEQAHEPAEAAIVSAEAGVHVAKLAAEAAGAELVSVERRSAAMRAAWAKADAATVDAQLDENERSLSAEAVLAERRAAVAKARHAVAGVEFKLQTAPADAKAAIEIDLAAARETLSKSEQGAAAAVTPTDQYTPLVGAKWTPTRFLSSLVDDPTVTFPDHSTGRRTALAAWMTDRRNPLTARVAVNHIWARHMGAPLVATVFDFGRKGSPPTHPELLDWLAAEFIDSGWDMRHLHRLIVMSSAYRMSSSVARCDANVARDPDNLRLWRRAPIRLEAEVLRDSILELAGMLDAQRGGPPVLPPVQADSMRRSLYFFHSNNERNPFLAIFDAALVKECYRRDESIVPQQALALSNSRIVHDAARKIAQRLSAPTAAVPSPSDKDFIKRAFPVVLGVPASEEEILACTNAMDAWRKLDDESMDGSDDPARQNLVWSLFNHNDFATLR
jgi:mono/diheme cytochrome c family protein